MKRIFKRIGMYFFILISLYLIIGNLLHRVILPEEKPDISTYFKPGQLFYSKEEGFRQHVIKQEGGLVHAWLEVEPFAPGPVKHIHDTFDELFEIENGELTIWVDGEIRKLHPGEKLLIPRGTPHKPYNETADTIRVRGSFAFPQDFAFGLVQIYGYMGEHQKLEASLKTLLQISLFRGAGLDSYIADGPPVFLQKCMDYTFSPLARLIGMKSHYEKYRPKLQYQNIPVTVINQ